MHTKYYTLITGASEGFGKALALECAGRKMNLILVALPGPELANLANFIKRNYSVDVIGIAKDLCKEENCLALFEEVSAMKLRVNMLVNNAGLGSTLLFSEGTLRLYETQIKLNILATTMLTRLFLEQLQKNSPANVLNVGSLSCYFTLAKKQVYGATKSYIYSFSKSLRCELKARGINVSVICPGCMYTNMSGTLLLKSSGWLARQSAMNPEEVATIAIEGLLKKREVIIPGNINKFLLVLNNLIPSFLKTFFINRQMRTLNSNALKTVPPSPKPTFSDAIPYYSINLKKHNHENK